MKYYAFVTAMAASGIWLSGAMAQNANRMEQPTDRTFDAKAAQGGLAEVQLGNLAIERGMNQRVKDFGRRMVNDHTKINNELQSVATSQGVTLPTTVDAADQAEMTHLSSLSGAAFDRAYMEYMVNVHKQDIAGFEHEANHGNDPQMRAFASKTLPILNEHLKLAEQTLADVRQTGQ